MQPSIPRKEDKQTELGLVLPEVPTGLTIVCQCGRHVPSVEFRDGACLDCRATAACAPHRAELVRLWRKRAKLQQNGASLSSNDAQAERMRQRIIRDCQKLVQGPRLGELINAQGQMAQEQTMSRIQRVTIGGTQ